MWDCQNAMNEEIVVALHPKLLSVFTYFFSYIFPLTSVCRSLLLYHPQKLMWVVEEWGNFKRHTRVLTKGRIFSSSPWKLFALRLARWPCCFHTCTAVRWDSFMLLQYLKYYFFPKFNPQMACVINSRRTVKTEHPFTGKDLNRHCWSSVEEKKDQISALYFLWRIIRNRCRNIPLFSTKHP